MTAQLTKTGLIDQQFFDFINQEVLTQLNMDANEFWQKFASLLGDFAPYNQNLLLQREQINSKLNEWQSSNPKVQADVKSCNGFLKEIGFLADEGPDFTIKTDNVDPEIANMAGPQLMVEAKNARYALNATNARWGSLYDALYGTDAIAQTDGLRIGKKHNQARGNRVIAFAKDFLDDTFPLDKGSHNDVTSYLVYYQHLLACFDDGSTVGLKNPSQFVALCGHKEQPTDIVLKNNGLHVVLEIDRNGMNGSKDLAGIDDIQVESALTSIMDLAQSDSTTNNKVQAYRNWMGLMRGSLHAEFDKDGEHIDRQLIRDKRFTCKDGDDYPLPGRTLLLARNAGLTSTSVLMQDHQGQDIPEGIVDTVVTALIGMLDKGRNSRTGSIYMVKPQLQGPQEVEFTCKLFSAVEDMLGLSRNTLKLGLMDDSPRTTVNLKECIRKAQDRLFLLNTELSLEQKTAQSEMFDRWNIDMGLACGLSGKAQIGRGMWPEQKQMAKMLNQKIEDVQAGASCAWVPCPSAATLHALHYHKVDVFKVQQQKHKCRVEATEQLQTMPLLRA